MIYIRSVLKIPLLSFCLISTIFAQWTFTTDNEAFVTSTYNEQTTPWPYRTDTPSAWSPTGGNLNGHIYHDITTTGLNDRFYSILQNSANGIGDLTGMTVYDDFRRQGGIFINGSGNVPLAYWSIGDTEDPTDNWWISKVPMSVDLNSLTLDIWLSQSIDMVEANFMKWANAQNTTKTFSQLISDYAFLGLTFLSDQVTEISSDPWNQYVNIGGVWRIPHYGVYSDNGLTVFGLDNIRGEATLPVKLSSFTAQVINTGVQLKWTTESEIENLGFILDRKPEGTNWSEIASYKTNDRLLGQGTISYATDYEYLDSFVEPSTTYEYCLADVDYNGVVTYHSIRTVTMEQASLNSTLEEFIVLPAYPNPFNPSTTIRYGLADEGTGRDLSVQVDIYDITGKLIATLLNEDQIPGWHSIIWNGTNQYNEQAPAGLYLSRITSDSEVKTTKLMLLK
ncbi:T9SS type A sorting domain-containing protein [bacterium]|nr:T9SS type A sorting domain-containing protein [bacterium]